MPRPEHVVIIGAGITGALTAHALLEAGVGVTVLEAREKGSGSSSRQQALRSVRLDAFLPRLSASLLTPSISEVNREP